MAFINSPAPDLHPKTDDEARALAGRPCALSYLCTPEPKVRVLSVPTVEDDHLLHALDPTETRIDDLVRTPSPPSMETPLDEPPESGPPPFEPSRRICTTWRSAR